MDIKVHITRRETEITGIRARIAREVAVLSMLTAAELEETAACSASMYGDPTVLLGGISSDTPTLRRALARLDVGGKAVKKPNGYTYAPGLDVTATLASGEKLTLLGQVPASCRIVEEEVEVPAEYIKAHTTKRKRLVCGEEE